jgi:hypothetical protein
MYLHPVPEVKNEWSRTATRHICLHGVDRDSFIFLPVPMYTAAFYCNSRYVRAVPFGASCRGLRLSVPIMQYRTDTLMCTLSLLCPVGPYKQYGKFFLIK